MTMDETMLKIIDEIDGDPSIPYDQRAIGEGWRSSVHVLIVLAGDGNGPQYAVAHLAGCDDECGVLFHLHEGGYEQPPGYPQIPTEPGLYLMRLEYVKGGWLTADHAIDHDAFLSFDERFTSLPHNNHSPDITKGIR